MSEDICALIRRLKRVLDKMEVEKDYDKIVSLAKEAEKLRRRIDKELYNPRR